MRTSGWGALREQFKKRVFGVLGRDLQAGGVHPGAGGEDDVRMVMGYLFQHLLCVHLRG